jgi:hypothetical protein
MKVRLSPSGHIWLLLALSVGTGIFGFLHQSRKSATNYQNIFWADASGYYIHGVAWWVWGSYSTTRLTPEIYQLGGLGYAVDSTRNLVRTKYPTGVALLQTPFVWPTHQLTRILAPEQATGFTWPYRLAAHAAAVWYLFWGLSFCFHSYRRLFPKSSDTLICGVCLGLVVGTSLLYYTALDPCYSHVYGFFCCSAVVAFTPVWHCNPSLRNWAILGILLGISLNLRLTNGLFLLLPILYSCKKPLNLLSKPNFLIQNSTISGILSAMLGATAVWVPQMVYWYLQTGSILTYSYQNETFSNLTDPALLYVLFSTNNGLLTWTPWLLFGLLGYIWALFRQNTWMQMAYWLPLVCIWYANAAWWIPNFGCSYGHRAFTEYLPLVGLGIVPVGLYIQAYRLELTFWLLSVILWAANTRSVVRFDTCWVLGDWEWSAFVCWYWGICGSG